MEVQSIIDECLQLWKDPYPHLAQLRDKGEKPVAVFCSYTPEEILHAAGLTPVRLMGAVRTITHADAHLQAYCCSLARTDLDMALAGELDYLEGAVFVQTCDTMMRLSDIWRRNTDFPFHGDLVLPIRMGEETSLPFLVEEVRRFRHSVEEFTGETIWDDALEESIHIYNRNRRLADRLYKLRSTHPGVIDGLSATACLVAGFWMRREQHNELLHDLLEGLDTGMPQSDDKTPLLVSGSVCILCGGGNGILGLLGRFLLSGRRSGFRRLAGLRLLRLGGLFSHGGGLLVGRLPGGRHPGLGLLGFSH